MSGQYMESDGESGRLVVTLSGGPYDGEMKLLKPYSSLRVPSHGGKYVYPGCGIQALWVQDDEETPSRTETAFRLTLPADTPNVDYAVRALLNDPMTKPRIVVDVVADLTPEQVQKVATITKKDLIDVRNGMNPTTIFGVELVGATQPAEHVKPNDAEFRKAPAKADEFPKFYVLADSPLGKQDWQYIARLSDHEAAFMQALPGNVLQWFDWHGSAFPGDHNVRTGVWVETSRDKAMWPGKYSEQGAVDLANGPDISAEVQIEPAPKPGIDWASLGRTEEFTIVGEYQNRSEPLQLELRDKFDAPGIWVYLVAGEVRIAMVSLAEIQKEQYTFPINVPCVRLCDVPRVKWPVGYRQAVMPKDYGKTVMYFSDECPSWGSGRLAGMVPATRGHKDLMLIRRSIDGMDGGAETIVKTSPDHVFIVDTEPETI
jgi:hypothetical protein